MGFILNNSILSEPQKYEIGMGLRNLGRDVGPKWISGGGCGPARHPCRKGPDSEIEDIFVCEEFFFLFLY